MSLIVGALVGANVPGWFLRLARLRSGCGASEPISAANDRFPSERSCADAGRQDRASGGTPGDCRLRSFVEAIRHLVKHQSALSTPGSEIRASCKSSSCWRHMVNAQDIVADDAICVFGCVIVKYRKAIRLLMGLCRQFNSPMRESRRRIAGTYIVLPCRWQHQPETHWAGAEFLVRATL